MTEADLKRHLRDDNLKQAYFLYGDEPYLTLHYANKIVQKACGNDANDFNFQQFDGQETELSEIVSAVETLPFGADSKCVYVREIDATKLDDTTLGYWKDFLSDLPDTGILVLRITSIKVDGKATKIKKLITLFEQYGVVVEFPQQQINDCVRLLISGAKKRGCEMDSNVATALVERCGTNLYRLINELEKLCAIAGGNAISMELVKNSTAESLEARVFDLSKMILQRNGSRAFAILEALKEDKEKPVSILSVLSNAFADLYRVKVAKGSGVVPESLAADFNYKRREFVLQNAARDVASVSIENLRKCIDVLAKADISMKSSSADTWLILDKTVSNLIELRREKR